MYRVIWRAAPLSPAAFAQPLFSALASLESAFDGIPTLGSPEPVFPRRDGVAGPGPLGVAGAFLAAPSDPMASYSHVFVADAAGAKALADRLSGVPGVSGVELQPRPTVAVMPPAVARAPGSATPLHVGPTPNYRGCQRYLNPAPGGVSIAAARALPGGDGAGIRVVDIEYGWNFHHEDLRVQAGGVIFGTPSDDDHGTAVLGVFSGDANAKGVEGLAPGALALAAAGTYDDERRRWNFAAALLAAATRLRPGDVILLEMHAPGPRTPANHGESQDGFVPVEYWEADQRAIQEVTRRGIHVVEAAGNGAENLDDPVYGGRFDRARHDSGAIMVGAGGSGLGPTTPGGRCSFSNYGSRVDVQGWGEDVVTSGGLSADWYHDLQRAAVADRCYTRSFGGTSSATPIVAGCVAVLEGVRRAHGRGPLSPREMRSLLVRTGTPQAGGAEEPIGPLPNLAAALAEVLTL